MLSSASSLPLSIIVSSQRGMGREDEIAVLDVSPDGRHLRAITAAAPSRPSSSSHEGGSGDRLLHLDSDGCVALAAAAALLKGLPHALMERRRQLSSSGGGSGGSGGGPHDALVPPSWMPELAVPESLMLAVYPGGLLPVVTWVTCITRVGSGTLEPHAGRVPRGLRGPLGVQWATLGHQGACGSSEHFRPGPANRKGPSTAQVGDLSFPSLWCGSSCSAAQTSVTSPGQSGWVDLLLPVSSMLTRCPQ